MRISKKLIWFILFFVLLIFFGLVHPIQIFDTDDWTYIWYTRPAYPVWGLWNPTRVFPETMMSFLSLLGFRIFYPVTGKFIESFACTYAVLVSAAVVWYVYLFFNLLCSRFKASRYLSALFSALFLIFHFVIFRAEPRDNVHMFYSPNACTYFYYTIPNIMNCAVILKLLTDDFLYDPIGKAKSSYYRNSFFTLGLWLVVIYFALVSNLFSSIILAVFIGMQFLTDCFRTVKQKEPFSGCLKKNILRLLYLLLWLIVQVFEVFGGRASSVSLMDTLGTQLQKTISMLWSVRSSFNGLFLVAALIILLSAFGI